MHYRLIITTKATDSSNAIAIAKGWLAPQKEEYVRNPAIEDEDEDGAYTHTGFWDWYVIGGRWSGALMLAYYPDFWEVSEEVKKKHQLDFYTMFPSGERASKQAEAYDELTALWQAKMPPEYNHLPCPFQRDEYVRHGEYPDDVQVVNEPILKFIQTRWKPEPDQFNCIYSHDMDNEVPNESFVGNKWAVVIDYHC